MSTLGPKQKIEMLYKELVQTENAFVRGLTDLTYRIDQERVVQALNEYDRKYTKKPNPSFSSPDEINAAFKALLALHKAVSEFTDYLDENKLDLDPTVLAKKFQALEYYFFEAGKADLVNLRLPESLQALIGLEKVELNNVLITPAQRGPRYNMLLAEMLKNVKYVPEYNEQDFQSAAKAAADIPLGYNAGQAIADTKKITQTYGPLIEKVKTFRKPKHFQALAKALVEETPNNLDIIVPPLSDSSKRETLKLGLEKLAQLEDVTEKNRKAPIQQKLYQMLIDINKPVLARRKSDSTLLTSSAQATAPVLSRSHSQGTLVMPNSSKILLLTALDLSESASSSATLRESTSFTPALAAKRIAEFKTHTPAKSFHAPQARKEKENVSKAGEPLPSKQLTK
ncbi:MAG: hypothetical protein JSR17_11320 [Proteobacteria bacterium]|nr:hypothetical protein [Pseudomonadota bacterium]